jgi:hypothetical protein
MTDPRDERFSIEGDPEEALRALMSTPARGEYQVTITEAPPLERSVIWVGEAPDGQTAERAALDAWDQKYGEGQRPEAFRLDIKPLDDS